MPFCLKGGGGRKRGTEYVQGSVWKLEGRVVSLQPAPEFNERMNRIKSDTFVKAMY